MPIDPNALTDFLAYCREHGLHGSYSARQEGSWWRAKVRVGMKVFTGPANTREDALNWMAGAALKHLRDPEAKMGLGD